MRARRKSFYRRFSRGDVDIAFFACLRRARLVRGKLVPVERLIAIPVVLVPAFRQGRFALRFRSRNRAIPVCVEPLEKIASDITQGFLLMLRGRNAALVLPSLLLFLFLSLLSTHRGNRGRRNSNHDAAEYASERSHGTSSLAGMNDASSRP